MAITPSVEFDQSSGRLLGDVTLPSHSGSAIRGLVFMLGGITTRWKQIVGYHCTGNSVNGTALKAMALYIIKRASAIGLHVVAVTSDMGSGRVLVSSAVNTVVQLTKYNILVIHPGSCTLLLMSCT